MNSRDRKKKPVLEECGVEVPHPISEADYKRSIEETIEETIENRKQELHKKFSAIMPAIVSQLDQLQAEVFTANYIQGFWDGPDNDNVASKIALMHSELSEALEADRKGIESDDKIPDFTGLESELADCVIRILDFSGRHNLRLGEAIQAKLLFNLTRPNKHGKKY